MSRYNPPPNDRVFKEDWQYSPDQDTDVITFRKPEVRFNVSPPVEPVEDYLENDYQNHPYRESTHLPDAVAELPAVQDALGEGWILANPAEFEAHLVDEPYGEKSMKLDCASGQAEVSSIRNRPAPELEGTIVQIVTDWVIDVDPTQPLLITHPAFVDHSVYTTLSQVIHPEQYEGDLILYLRINDFPSWVKYGDALAHIVPLPNEMHDGFTIEAQF